jgi:hypothetical protein
VMRQVAHSSVPMAALMHSGLCPVHRGFIAIGRSPRADGAGPFAIPNPNEGAPDPSHLGIGDSPDLTKPVTEKRYFRSVPANALQSFNLPPSVSEPMIAMHSSISLSQRQRAQAAVRVSLHFFEQTFVPVSATLAIIHLPSTRTRLNRSVPQ